MAQSDPLYRQIAADLRERIRAGQLKAGERLPTEVELREKYGVSRNTVRLAFAMLQNEGMITSVQGRGTIVRDQVMATYHASWAESRDRMSSDQVDAFHAEIAAQGRRSQYRDFEMRIVPASPDLAERLAVEEGDSLVSRSFTRHVDDGPSSLQDSYYPMDIAQQCGLLTPHDVPEGAIRAVAAQGHVEIGYVDETAPIDGFTHDIDPVPATRLAKTVANGRANSTLDGHGRAWSVGPPFPLAVAADWTL